MISYGSVTWLTASGSRCNIFLAKLFQIKCMERDSSYYHKQRKELVRQILMKGINDSHVLDAIANVPRHLFMGEDQQDIAYVDKAYPIGEGQTISQPYTVAYQSQLLKVSHGVKVLEIGTGSGYQAAVLATMGAEVFTIERQRALYARNEHFEFLRSFSNIHFFYGDGYEGLPDHAPFDRILITAAAPSPPPKLLDQLADNGIMVLPMGEHEKKQIMVRITKQQEGKYYEETFDQFSFVPMVRGVR